MRATPDAGRRSGLQDAATLPPVDKAQITRTGLAGIRFYDRNLNVHQAEAVYGGFWVFFVQSDSDLLSDTFCFGLFNATLSSAAYLTF